TRSWGIGDWLSAILKPRTDGFSNERVRGSGRPGGSTGTWCRNKGPLSPSMFRKPRSEEHTSELQSRRDLVCRLLLEKKKTRKGRPCRWRSCRRQRGTRSRRWRHGGSGPSVGGHETCTESMQYPAGGLKPRTDATSVR